MFKLILLVVAANCVQLAPARHVGDDDIVVASCGDTMSTNATYFVNPGYGGADTGSGACTLTINHLTNSICQLRLDFVDFNIGQPDSDGTCMQDFLMITPSSVPIICGDNAGQHMYVDVDPTSGPIRLNVDRATTSTAIDRQWSIQVSEIPCDSASKAPTGCLQYFTQTEGIVQSFNFDFNLPEQGTREIANMNYGVCIEPARGYCGVKWERVLIGGDTGFTVSGNVQSVPGDILGTSDASSIGQSCTTDHVIIPNAVTDVGSQVDRFCGLGFPYFVTSYAKPFMLFVNHNGDEVGDFDNVGFSLRYRQIPC